MLKTTRARACAIVIGAVAIVGCQKSERTDVAAQPPPKVPEAGPKATVYTCPMHPEIERKEPGKCPICGMDLVPKKDVK